MKITNEEILEGDRLIAEFIKWEITGPGFPAGYSNNDNLFYQFHELKFHSSWDWLMPVVEKIEKMQPTGYNTLIENRNCWIEVEGSTFEAYSKNSKIEAVYNAVVEFIKWYNGNKNRN